MEERILRRIEQLVEAAEGRFPAKLGEEWSGLGRVEQPVPARSRVERVEPERAEERYTPRGRLERIEPEQAEERFTRRSRLERVEPELERTPASRVAASTPGPAQPVAQKSEIGALLHSRKSLRQAILVHEILGPPKALRDDAAI